MKRGHVNVIQLSGTSCHEVVPEGNVVRLSQLRLSIIIGLKHLSDHHLCQWIFMHATRSFMDEHIVVNLSKARDAVGKRDCRVKSEQSQVEVSTSYILTLKSDRALRVVLWVNIFFSLQPWISTICFVRVSHSIRQLVSKIFILIIVLRWGFNWRNSLWIIITNSFINNCSWS